MTLPELIASFWLGISLLGIPIILAAVVLIGEAVHKRRMARLPSAQIIAFARKETTPAARTRSGI